MNLRSSKKIGVKSAPQRRQADADLSEADVDAFVAGHREELNASIKRARAEVKKGIHSARTVKDIAAAGLKKFRGRAGRAAR